METSVVTQLVLSSVATQTPVIIVLLVAVVMVLSRWNEARGAALWAMSGFGLALLVTLVAPIAQILLQRVFLGSGAPTQKMVIMITVSSVFWAILRAASYAMILMAVFAGRRPSPAVNEDIVAPRPPGA